MALWLVLKGLVELRLVVGKMLVFLKGCLMNCFLFLLGEMGGWIIFKMPLRSAEVFDDQKQMHASQRILSHPEGW